MTKLEASDQAFDWKNADLYRNHVQKYVDKKRVLFPGSPVLVDVSNGEVGVPDDLNKRIEAWLKRHPEYSPFMRTFAQNYIISLLDDSFDDMMYEHLADCVVAGGDFYVETGMFYIRDAAAVSSLH